MTDDFPAGPDTTGFLPNGGNVRGTLETADDVDWFRIALDTDHAYLFSATMADGSAPIVTVWNDTLHTVQYTTALGGLYTDELYNPFVPRDAGSYYLQVSGARAGSYTVGMRVAPDDHGNAPASAQALVAGTPAAARFDYAFDRDQFRIAGEAGKAYTVTLRTDDGTIGSAAWLSLTLDGNPYLSASGGATLSYRFVADATRDYFIAANMASYGPPAAGGMPYHVSVSVADGAGPRALSSDASVDGAIRVSYDEPLHRGSGRIYLQDQRGYTVDSWNVAGENVRIDGNALTLLPAHFRALLPGKYALRFDTGSLVDASGNTAQATPYAAMMEVAKTGAGGVALDGGIVEGIARQGGASAADAVVYDGDRKDYTIARSGDVFKVGAPWRANPDTLSGIERVMFTKSAEVVALSLDGLLGQAFRLYTAAFDRKPDETGLGFWLHAAESGVSLAAMARGFIDSKEFASKYGSQQDDAAFVAALYRNVLHRDGDAGGAAFWRAALAKGVDRAEVLAAVSESHENQEQVASLVGNGIAYTPYG